MVPDYDINAVYHQIKYYSYYSEYLPASFNLIPSSYDIDIFQEDFSQIGDVIEPHSFSMSKLNNSLDRRKIYIPELYSYVRLINYAISNNIIKEIIDFTIEFSNSFSPILDKNGDIFTHDQAYNGDGDESIAPKYIENIINKINKSKGAIEVLKIDISNCYANFYTHMIPAIILGKDVATENYKEYCRDKHSPLIDEKYFVYSKFDSMVRAMNGNRTNGLLPGPIISKILCEGLLTQIDIDLKKLNINYSRYVDDFEFYIYDKKDVEKITSIIQQIFNNYYFTINGEKTIREEYPFYITNNFRNIISKYFDNKLDNLKIMDLFNKFYTLEKNGTKGAIKYLLKVIESERPNIESDLFSSYLLDILNNDDRAALKAYNLILREALKNDSCVVVDQIFVDIIKRTLERRLSNVHDLEVIWLTYLITILISHGKLDKHDFDIQISNIIKNGNDLASIILLHELDLSAAQKDLLKNTARSWILLYELYNNDLIPRADFLRKASISKNARFYDRLKENGFSFYNNDLWITGI
ncbi:RNA-directed DNA polymerase [Christensenella tenuis]|uniref:RNA-directed DNA polymerase n=1 Tax=Christensenella tenuis TaxID=2763033 RepID=A0ABR7ECV7_9FIRM|nr:RNA-directed DNA polymerase [Christensenella tenuis]MBC5647610.1 RNA-directed DNA polymerase [Christensenella tenuis]